MITVKSIQTGVVKENCYIVLSSNNDCIIIDPGSNSKQIIDSVETFQLAPHAILNTHGHFDHIGAVADIKKHFNIPFFIHSQEERTVKSANLYMKIFQVDSIIEIPEIDVFVDNTKSPLTFGDLLVYIIPTPGHSKGSVSFLINDYLFTGDTLFKGAIGRIDLPGGSKEHLNESLRKIAKLPPHLLICAGHGESSTIEKELNNNQKFGSLSL